MGYNDIWYFMPCQKVGWKGGGEEVSEKPYVVRTHDMKMDAEYIDWIQELKRRYQAAQIKAAVKVNSEQLLFNWQLGRDLVIRRAEEKWGNGVVEQISLDLQAAFPGAKGFSARNLWWMKQWYVFYTGDPESQQFLSTFGDTIKVSAEKLNQVGSEIRLSKLTQVGSESPFPSMFAFVPGRSKGGRPR